MNKSAEEEKYLNVMWLISSYGYARSQSDNGIADKLYGEICDEVIKLFWPA